MASQDLVRTQTLIQILPSHNLCRLALCISAEPIKKTQKTKNTLESLTVSLGNKS